MVSVCTYASICLEIEKKLTFQDFLELLYFIYIDQNTSTYKYK